MKNFMDFAQKTFFPKNLLPNSGCGLSTDAAYTRVNTVVRFSFFTVCYGFYTCSSSFFWITGAIRGARVAQWIITRLPPL